MFAEVSRTRIQFDKKATSESLFSLSQSKMISNRYKGVNFYVSTNSTVKYCSRTDHTFLKGWGGGGFGQYKKKSCTAKTAGKKSCKGSHGKKKRSECFLFYPGPIFNANKKLPTKKSCAT